MTLTHNPLTSFPMGNRFALTPIIKNTTELLSISSYNILASKKHENLAKEITGKIINTFKIPLLPSEVLYLKYNVDADVDILVDNIIKYRLGSLYSLHSDYSKIEIEYFQSLDDRNLPDGRLYTVKQQIEDINSNGGLLEYERSTIRTNKIGELLGKLNHRILAKEYWAKLGIYKPENVLYVYKYPQLPSSSIYSMPSEGDTRKEQVEKLEKIKAIDASYCRLIEQEMGKRFLYSVNQNELESVNWEPEAYAKKLKERAMSLVDEMNNHESYIAHGEYVQAIFKSALTSPQISTSTDAAPFFIRPKIYGYPLENMLLIRDGGKYTMISLMPPGCVHVFFSKQELNEFVFESENHEFLLSHASLYHQMDGREYSGIETALKGFANPGTRASWKPHENIFPSKNHRDRLQGHEIFFNLAVSSIGNDGVGHIIKTDLINALRSSYWKGISGTHTVETIGDYKLPVKYRSLEGGVLFEKLYSFQTQTDMQRLVEKKISEFEESNLQEYALHLSDTIKRLTNSVHHIQKISDKAKSIIEAAKLCSEEVVVSMPGIIGKKGYHLPLESLLLIKENKGGNLEEEMHVLVSLYSDGAVVEFKNEDSYFDFFSNPINRNFILSHLAEYDKQPVIPGGDCPEKTLEWMAAWSNVYRGTKYVVDSDHLRVAFKFRRKNELTKGGGIPTLSSPNVVASSFDPRRNIDNQHIVFGRNDNVLEVVARRNLERLKKDADALLTSHSEWRTQKVLEVAGGVLAIPAVALSIAAIIASAGAATPAVVAGIAGSALIIDVASLGVGLTEGCYLLIEGDSPEERVYGVIPLALTPLDMLGVGTSAASGLKSIRALKSARKVIDTGSFISDVRRQTDDIHDAARITTNAESQGTDESFSSVMEATQSSLKSKQIETVVERLVELVEVGGGGARSLLKDQFENTMTKLTNLYIDLQEGGVLHSEKEILMKSKGFKTPPADLNNQNGAKGNLYDYLTPYVTREANSEFLCLQNLISDLYKWTLNIIDKQKKYIPTEKASALKSRMLRARDPNIASEEFAKNPTSRAPWNLEEAAQYIYFMAGKMDDENKWIDLIRDPYADEFPEIQQVGYERARRIFSKNKANGVYHEDVVDFSNEIDDANDVSNHASHIESEIDMTQRTPVSYPESNATGLTRLNIYKLESSRETRTFINNYPGRYAREVSEAKKKDLKSLRPVDVDFKKLIDSNEDFEWVFTKERELVIGSVSHLVLAEGEDVISAGHARKIGDGKIWISNESVYYQAAFESINESTEQWAQLGYELYTDKKSMHSYRPTPTRANLPFSPSETATARDFFIQGRQFKGRIDSGKFEVSYDDGVTWRRGGRVLEFAWRMQNSGPGGNPFKRPRLEGTQEDSGRLLSQHTEGHIPSDGDASDAYLFSQEDMRMIFDVSERMRTQGNITINSEELRAIDSFPEELSTSHGSVINISDEELINLQKAKFLLVNWDETKRAPSFSLGSDNLPPLSDEYGLADCGQFASGCSGGNYLVGTISPFNNEVFPLAYATPSYFEQAHRLTRDDFIASKTPPNAQGIAFLDVNTKAYHYGRINPDGSISQTDANSFGLLGSNMENQQRSSMQVLQLADKSTFVTYCDIMYDPEGNGKYFYVYFGA